MISTAIYLFLCLLCLQANSILWIRLLEISFKLNSKWPEPDGSRWGLKVWHDMMWAGSLELHVFKKCPSLVFSHWRKRREDEAHGHRHTRIRRPDQQWELVREAWSLLWFKQMLKYTEQWCDHRSREHFWHPCCLSSAGSPSSRTSTSSTRNIWRRSCTSTGSEGSQTPVSTVASTSCPPRDTGTCHFLCYIYSREC